MSDGVVFAVFKLFKLLGTFNDAVSSEDNFTSLFVNDTVDNSSHCFVSFVFCFISFCDYNIPHF